MKTSEKLKSISCDPDGIVCISGSDGDRRILQEVIKEIQILEKNFLDKTLYRKLEKEDKLNGHC